MIQRMNVNLIVLFSMSILLMNIASAADIETLLMPGKVIQGHAKYESECSRCHARFKKNTQSQLCRDCHEKIDADLLAGEGYHGLNPEIAETPCKICHTEHIGRDANVAILNHATFDHNITDFKLENSHETVSCTACHQSDKKFSEAPSGCFDCHGEQDPHKGNLGEQCGECHSSKAWKKFDFNHDITEFPLLGEHKDVACNSCHLNTRYEETPKNCNACHSLNDVHNGRNGTQCEDCHSPRNWIEPKFEHDRDTDFPLTGRHKKVVCEACHKKAVAEVKPEKDCYSCHKNDDQHSGRYGEKCDSCHTEKGWKHANFDHDKNTKFPLKGKHSKLACSACHRGELDKEDLAMECHSCHLSDDVHQGQEGKQCQRCHQESSWSERVVFDHDLTRFPLLGMHASAPCEECHMSAAFQDTESECNACHKDDDEHKASLGPACQLCHNPNDWGIWLFEHDTQTDFKLDGAHKDLGCGKCHYKPVKTKVDQSSSCHACHEHDDTHRGRFGRQCERCHNTENFNDVTLR